jgi:hypothetical protein
MDCSFEDCVGGGEWGHSEASAVAVLTLMAKANLVGCPTGMSRGLVRHFGGLPKQIGVVRSIEHETTGLDIIVIAENRRQALAKRQSDNAG